MSYLQGRWVAIFLILFCVCAGCAPSSTVLTVPTPQPLADELTFYGWNEDFSPDLLNAFTTEYGVRINYVSYTSQKEAADDIRAGKVYDLAIMSNELVGTLANEGLLAPLSRSELPNFKNISPNFRDLVFDPNNTYSVPYNWGIVFFIARQDLLQKPITSWSDLWNLPPDQKIIMWPDFRNAVGIALLSLGYSINSEDPAELEAARKQLLRLRPNVLIMKDDDTSFAPYLASGEAVIGLNAGSNDVIESQTASPEVALIQPSEGTMLWGDNFVIPANSAHKSTAEAFLNFLLRPESAVQMVEWNYYATPNDNALPLLPAELTSNELVFPPRDELVHSEIITPLSPETYQIYASIWDEFLKAGQE